MKVLRIALLIAGGFVLAVLPAAGSYAETGNSLVPTSVDQFCAVEIAPGSAMMPEPQCFDSKIKRDSYFDFEGIRQSTSEIRAASSSVVLGTLYKDANRQGASLTLWGAGTCSNATYGFASIALDWAHSVTSAASRSGCSMTLYTGTNYTGQFHVCATVCNSIGNVNDNVNSVVFRPSI